MVLKPGTVKNPNYSAIKVRSDASSDQRETYKLLKQAESELRKQWYQSFTIGGELHISNRDIAAKTASALATVYVALYGSGTPIENRTHNTPGIDRE